MDKDGLWKVIVAIGLLLVAIGISIAAWAEVLEAFNIKDGTAAAIIWLWIMAVIN